MPLSTPCPPAASEAAHWVRPSEKRAQERTRSEVKESDGTAHVSRAYAVVQATQSPPVVFALPASSLHALSPPVGKPRTSGLPPPAGFGGGVGLGHPSLGLPLASAGAPKLFSPVGAPNFPASRSIGSTSE
eukprot:210422_1